MRLRCERILTPAGVIAGEVAVDGERIVAVSPRPVDRVDPDVLDLGALWLAPGFIDTHVHGGGGAQCNTADSDEVDAVAAFHAQHGTTALLATTVAAPLEQLEASLAAIARSGAIVLGAHLEGPFLSREWPGAMDPAAFLDPDPAAVARLLRAGGRTLKMMTLAPELPGHSGADRRAAPSRRGRLDRSHRRRLRAGRGRGHRRRSLRHAPVQRDGAAAPP